jgi:multiple sugar transport system ATP-binding protein
VAERTPAAAGVHGNTLTARADVVEPLGSETFVYLTCGPHAIVARMESPERPLTVGQTLEVDLKMSKTHLFDKKTSQTIV